MNKLFLILFSIVFLGLLAPVFLVQAATNGYAWSNNIGWINFGCPNCNVAVSGTTIIGYAWNDNYGWINLNPPTSGVKNSATGALSGSAWGSNIGWVNFSGASINCSKKIIGTATGDIVGTVNFVCANCNVQTDWAPTSGCDTGGPTKYHNQCNALKQCESAVGDSPDLCRTGHNEDCAVGCENNADCGTDDYINSPICQDRSIYQDFVTYTCNNPGATNAYCSDSAESKLKADCPAELVCNNGNCIACISDNDCGVGTYTDDPPFCLEGDETSVYGNYNFHVCIDPGEANSYCYPYVAPQPQSSCEENQICKDGGCVDRPSKHNECVDSQCVQVDGQGPDLCQSPSDCIFTHTECDGSQCIPVNGAGPNQCDSSDVNNDCQHYECNYLISQCALTDGPGADSCQVGDACLLMHTECNGLQCVSIPGLTLNQCNSDDDCLPPKHNECNDQKQCVQVDGAGSDQCQADKDCNNVVDQIRDNIQESLPEPVKVVVEETKKAINSPEGSITTKTLSTTGIVVAAVATSSAFSFPFLEFFLIPLRLFGLLMEAFGLRKKIVPWGVVYDSITKRPLDPAYVVLKNPLGDIVASAITDMDGRYGFLVAPGVYKMEVRRTNFIFPSQKLAGRTHDELHQDLYLGGDINIAAFGDVITKNIPLDPLKFDWNEFAKKSKKLTKFYSKWDIILREAYDFFFVVGFIVAIVSFIFAPHPYNMVMVLLYVGMLIFRILGLKPRSFGSVIEKSTGNPLSYAIIRVVMPISDVVVSSKSADKYGRYYCLVPPGKYYIKVEKKNDDGSYSLVHTSPVMDTSKKGIIKEVFKI